MSSPSGNMEAFRSIVKKANHVVILTGAGVSAESGVPTFRGKGGFWRNYNVQELATAAAFRSNPSLVWEFFHYRRENMLSNQPNKAHLAIAEFELRLKKEGRHVSLVTQNIDELHQRAGSEKIYEIHGNLFKTKCLKCKKVEINRNSPICEALRGKGSPGEFERGERIPDNLLPRCKDSSCGGLLRPQVVFFHENLDSNLMQNIEKELNDCDLCLVVGTSSVVYPAAMFAPQVAGRGIPVAEFNMEITPVTHQFGFHFSGPCGELLPVALAP